MKYPPLEGICKECIYKCFKVEAPNFKGVTECKYAEKPIKEDLGIQEKIKL